MRPPLRNNATGEDPNSSHHSKHDSRYINTKFAEQQTQTKRITVRARSCVLQHRGTGHASAKFVGKRVVSMTGALGCMAGHREKVLRSRWWP